MAKWANKTIILYGTGIVAERFLKENIGLDIFGVMDRVKQSGEFNGYPIIDWNQVGYIDNGAVVIAASQKNYKEIFLRIRDKCARKNMEIYGPHGEDFRSFPWYDGDKRGDAEYYQNTEYRLKELISRHQFISFDVFDTLVVRSIVEPTDVFDMVQNVIDQRNLGINGFKELRIKADRETPLGTIYDIYENMVQKGYIEREKLEPILQLELICEEEVLQPRHAMVAVLQYAIQNNKRVSLISDMYIPGDLMEKYLHKLGITGYEKLYVSCDYGKRKDNGLFEIYKEETKGDSYLHIGDNEYLDIECAKTSGIEGFWIKSPMELMKMSNMHQLLGYENGFNDRRMIGMIANNLFCDPFLLGKTAGCVAISDIKKWVVTFIIPVMLVYISKIVNYVGVNKGYDGVLFAARDGYIPQKLYEIYREKVDPSLPKSYLLPVSRKLAFTICTDPTVWKEIKHRYYDSLEINRLDSEEKRNEYIEILNKMGINLDKKYIFSEVYSMGTTQAVISSLFSGELTGYYLMKYDFDGSYEVPIESVYTIDKETKYTNNLARKELLLETFLTAPYPAVKGVEKNRFVYEKEKRSSEELEILKEVEMCVQEAFSEIVQKHFELENVNDELPECIMRCVDDVIYYDGAIGILNCLMHDSTSSSEGTSVIQAKAYMCKL